MKTSTTQFKAIVNFMEKHGDLNRLPNGLRGRLETIKKWQILANLLNRDPAGDRRSLEKWKKVWSDLKNNTKRKKAKIEKCSNLPTHLRSRLVLNDLEKRVLHIIRQSTCNSQEEIEIQYMDAEPQDETPTPPDEIKSALDDETTPAAQEESAPAEQVDTTPTTENEISVQFISTELEPQMFLNESMSEENHSEFLTSTDDTSGRSTDASIESEEQVNNNNRVFRRSRRSKQSPTGLSRQAFEVSDSRWRKLFLDLASEHLRLRNRELRQQERWQELFERCVNCVEKFMNT